MSNDFYMGLAVALGCLARDKGMPSVAIDIMHMNGITYYDLLNAGASYFDLEPLHAEWRDTQ